MNLFANLVAISVVASYFAVIALSLIGGRNLQRWRLHRGPQPSLRMIHFLENANNIDLGEKTSIQGDVKCN